MNFRYGQRIGREEDASAEAKGIGWKMLEKNAELTVEQLAVRMSVLSTYAGEFDMLFYEAIAEEVIDRKQVLDSRARRRLVGNAAKVWAGQS